MCKLKWHLSEHSELYCLLFSEIAEVVNEHEHKHEANMSDQFSVVTTRP